MKTRPATKNSEVLVPCDQCFRRKIRCDRALPCCVRCTDAGVGCTREISRRQAGRKKGRGNVIARLRIKSSEVEWQVRERRSAELEERQTSGSERPEPKNLFPVGAAISPGSDGFLRSDTQSQSKTDLSADTPGASMSPYARQGTRWQVPEVPGRLLSRIPDLPRYIDLFFAHLYPIWPIISETDFREELLYPEKLDLSHVCLVLSMCSLTALHIESSADSSSEPRNSLAQGFIDQCRQLRLTFDYIGNGSIVTVQTSLFLSCAEVEFRRTRSSWFLLREAVMLAEELGLYEVDYLSPTIERNKGLSIRRTLYLISLVERGLTVLRSKPFSFIVFEPPEEAFEDENPDVLYGLQSLSRLFILLDKKFLDAWVSYTTMPTAEFLKEKFTDQEKLDILAAQEKLAAMTFDRKRLTEVQLVDISVTQQWLRLVFWQFSMRKGALSSVDGTPEPFRCDFPRVIAQSLCLGLSTIRKEAIYTHGIAIVSVPPLFPGTEITNKRRKSLSVCLRSHIALLIRWVLTIRPYKAGATCRCFLEY